VDVNEITEAGSTTAEVRPESAAKAAAPVAEDMFSPPPPGSAADAAQEVRRADFQPLTPRAKADPSSNLGRLMDVVVSITIELGATEMPLGEVLELGSGSVVKLDRVVGDPVDILVNHELVGRGEVVVVDDSFGVRVTELVGARAEKT
jgi:flagellar motor switch protein FliN